MSTIVTLSVEEVAAIHDRLTEDAANSDDPISPAGIKNEGMLHSAVARQQAGYGSVLKYSNQISNAASLCYGICGNHPFHNGNKRTALVSLLSHLDKNGYTFKTGTNQNILYSFLLSVAGHTIVPKKKIKGHDQSDLEVAAMADWIRKRTRRIEKGERSLSYPEFEKILKNHGVYFENHKNNYVDVVMYRMERRKKGWFGLGSEEVEVREKVANIPYWPGRPVGKKLVKSVRKQAELTHADGVDSALFYGTETPPDEFIQKYRKVLSKLAKT